MTTRKHVPFDSKDFLATIGDDPVFYIREGKVKVTVVSEQGKEAVVALLGKDEFLGQGCLTGRPKRMAKASTLVECEIMRIEKNR
jgi:CRP/FNR family transcriptional regulator, cyclic AMP receptor protein